MLNGKHDAAWDGSEQAQREVSWKWHDAVVEGGGVRDRVRRWWHARGSGLDSPETREDSELEEIQECVECGDRFLAPLGTLRCMSCCDQEW